MDFLAGFWAELSKFNGFVVEVAVGVVTALIIAAAGYIYRRQHRSVIKQITRPSDPDIGAIEYLQGLIFPENELDPPGVLAEKIRHSNFDIMKKPNSTQCLILLCHKVNGQINGYISAEYFVESRIIFFWYLVSVHPRKVSAAISSMDRQGKALADAYDKETALLLIKRLSAICNKIGKPWRYVMAEVDSEDPKNALARLAQFQAYRKAILNQMREQGMTASNAKPSAVSKVDIDFMMPLHEPGMLAQAEAHETPAWLVIAAQRQIELASSEDGYVLTRADAEAMLRALQKSYTDVDEKAYNNYLAAFYGRLIDKLPDYCRLQQLRSEIMKPRQKPTVEKVLP